MSVYHADGLDFLRSLAPGSVDLVFADPPFNVGKAYGGSAKNDRMPDDEYRSWVAEWVALAWSALKDTGVLCFMTLPRYLDWQMPLMAAGGVFINLIQWRNVQAVRAPRCLWTSVQPIMVYGKTPGYTFNQYAEVRKIPLYDQRYGGYSTEPKGQLLDYWDDIPFVYAGSIRHPEAVLQPGTNKKAHPAQMPVGLAVRLISFFTMHGGLVVDPFLGSGSTAVGCVRTGRSFAGAEKELKYCRLIRDRVREAESQSVMLFP